MYACIAVAALARGVSRIYCLTVILVLHGEGVGLQVQNYKLFFILCFFCLFFHFRPYLLDGDLHLLAVDVDGYPAGAALCHKPVVLWKKWSKLSVSDRKKVKENRSQTARLRFCCLLSATTIGMVTSGYREV